MVLSRSKVNIRVVRSRAVERRPGSHRQPAPSNRCRLVACPADICCASSMFFSSTINCGAASPASTASRTLYWLTTSTAPCSIVYVLVFSTITASRTSSSPPTGSVPFDSV